MLAITVNLFSKYIFRHYNYASNIKYYNIVSNQMKQVRLICPRIFSTDVIIQDQTYDDEKLEEIVSQICKDDKELENQLRILMLELEVMKQNGKNVPNIKYIKKEHWEELLKKSSLSSRRKYLIYLFKTSMTKENRKIKKEQKKQEQLQLKELEPRSIYSLCGRAMFIRIYEKSMNKLYNTNAIKSMLYGQKLILDCSYDEHMTDREKLNAAEQIMVLFGDNRIHVDPFDLHVCNVAPNGQFYKLLKKCIPTIYDPEFPLHVHSESYLDLFPTEKLVYLTPHCRNDLEYNDDDIYIIGGIVDKSSSVPISSAKAKQHKLRMAKLPLDNYAQWNPGSGKSLTINQVCNILLDYKITRDWNYALKHVPRRKIFGTNKTDENISNIFNYHARPSTNKIDKSNLVQNNTNSINKYSAFNPKFSFSKKKILKEKKFRTIFNDE